MLKLPAMTGVIRRRILVNYRVDPSEMATRLPSRFRPKLHQGFSIAGICLIRLEHMRPHGLPAGVGISSENAAHRVAVEWTDDDGTEREGVYILRRDTGSALNVMAGGRLFPGEQHHATFNIAEEGDRLDLQMRADDGAVQLHVCGAFNGVLPPDSCFSSLDEASNFFEKGHVGYSVTKQEDRLDGVSLHTDMWQVTPFEVEEVFSSHFYTFPSPSIKFDCALAMRDIDHEWRSVADIRV